MNLALTFELAIVLFGGFLGGLAASKFKQPLFLGYIVSGLILGALFPYLEYNNQLITLLAQVGVALLLFSLGLEFPLDRVTKVGKGVVFASLGHLLIVTLIFTLFLTLIFGMPVNVSVFIGAVVSLSSTAIVHKLLSQKGELESSQGDLIMAWLVVQNVAIIPIFYILPILTNVSSFSLPLLGFAVIKSLLAVYLIFLFGRKTVPYLFKKLALYDNRELLLVSAFLFCTLIAILSSASGINFVIGAFLAGVLLSTTAVNHEVFTEIKPLRDVFTSVFFVSIGMIISINWSINVFFIALGIAFFAVIIKFIVIFILGVVLNYHSKIAFVTSLALFQIGEFGFILAKTGLDSGILNNDIYKGLVLASVFTVALTPIAYSSSINYYNQLKKLLKNYFHSLYNYIFKNLDSDSNMPNGRKINFKDHVVIVGYGRVGSYVCNILELSKIPYVVIDINFKTLYSLRRKGLYSVYGDAVNRDVLDVAGASVASSIIIATPDVVTNELVLNHARKLNPNIKTIIRAHNQKDIAKFTIKGVKNIIEPEYEAGIEMGRVVLANYGISSNNIEKFLKTAKQIRRY